MDNNQILGVFMKDMCFLYSFRIERLAHTYYLPPLIHNRIKLIKGQNSKLLGVKQKSKKKFSLSNLLIL